MAIPAVRDYRCRVLGWVVHAAGLCLIPLLTLGSQEASREQANLPGAAFFSNTALHLIEITVPGREAVKLRQKPRDFVQSEWSVDGKLYSEVGIHLKGAVGSFRPFEDKPCLTVDFARFNESQRLLGLRRIHLNNSVEDPSFANEMLGSELFQTAGIPAPRVAHALVRLNGRKLGLYVIKEGFTEDFLACHFPKISSELYEPMNGSDIDGELKRNSVHAPPEKSASFSELTKAALEPDLALRWQSLEKLMDLKRFLTFMALEVMICHRDGYTLARNNFRVYHDSDTGKWLFFPHGMDQLFGRADLPTRPNMSGLLARAVLETSQGKLGYEQAFGSLFTNLFCLQVLDERIDQLLSACKPALGTTEYAHLQAEADDLKLRMAKRRSNLAEQLNEPRPTPARFEAGFAQLQQWIPIDVPPGGRLQKVKSPDGLECLLISTRTEASPSWRSKLLLTPGRYRFEGRVRVAAVLPLSFGQHQGAGLRVGGHVRFMDNLTGDSAWQPLATSFEVKDSTQEIDLICELRARSGEAWFDLGSLKLIQDHK